MLLQHFRMGAALGHSPNAMVLSRDLIMRFWGFQAGVGFMKAADQICETLFVRHDLMMSRIKQQTAAAGACRRHTAG
jgi:hypothetical protein